MVGTRSAWSRVPGFLKHVNMIATKNANGSTWIRNAL